MTSSAPLQDRLLAGFALQQQGRLDEAAAAYRDVLAQDPRHFDALHLLGVIAAAQGDFAAAVTTIGRALAVNAENAAAHYNMGYALEGLQRAGDALAHYDRAIVLRPDYVAAYMNRGTVLFARKQFPAALADLDRVLDFSPQDADAHLARALIRRETRDLAGALADCDRALTVRADDANIHATRGAVLADLHRHRDALASFDAALALRPDLAEAHTNRGLSLATLGKADAALACFEAAIRCSPALAAAHYHKGMHLTAQGQHEAALACFERAFTLSPDFDYLLGQRLFTQMRLCDWSRFAGDIAEIAARIMRGERAAPAFVAVAFTDAPALHRRAAEIQTAAECPPDAALGPLGPRTAASKLRLGYFSMDFRIHPVAQLTAGLFEAHDRSRFEVHAFSYGPHTGDAMRRRLEKGFDHFHDVRAKTDIEIAALARSLGIDIAIDLGGHTIDSRGGILALRAAPVQVSYIGYPATMGAAYIDYIVADRRVLPDDTEITEKIVRLPWFQANDNTRVAAARSFTRAELGLPAQGFVYCCFNNSYKITPAMFGVWMRILARAPGSVLWLTADNTTAADNLRREAARRGIDPARLVFAARVLPPDYLARMPAADLFLDTLPYNAGTTASDALWMGLPVLTCPGHAYSARMAASLLHTVGLPQLVAATPEAYEDLAVALAGDPARMSGFRRHLARRDSPLFDAGTFAGHIERAFEAMMTRHRAGLAPDHIEIA